MRAPPLDDPAWLPHALTSEGVLLAHATPDALRRAAFLDGREAFADATCTVSEKVFVAAGAGWPKTPLPAILHVSFCGSTLLARMLDVPGRTIVYREPAFQIGLADRHAAGGSVEALLLSSTAAFTRPVAGATAIVKPTNWANALLPVWGEARAIRPAFVTMAPRAFLTAVFRGGRERISFTLRVAEHLARVTEVGPTLIASAAGSSTVSLERAAALVITALALQCRLFADARRRLSCGDGCVVDAAEVFADPHAAALRVAAALGIADLTPASAETRHAKGGAAHSAERERAANAAVEAGNRDAFAHALRWAETKRLSFAV